MDHSTFTESDQPWSLVPAHILATPSTLILALPGGGCSPRIYDAVKAPRSVLLHALDWASGSGPFDPRSVAARIALALAQRRGPTVLLGHSLGGVIALLAALAAPRQVHGLVISNTGARISGHADPDLVERIRHRWDSETQQAFLRNCFMQQPQAALWRHLCEYLARHDRQALLEAVAGLRQLDDLTPRLAGLHACPTVIAHGRHDTRRPLAAAEHLAACIPGARLELLPGGHTPMVDCPGEYSASVRALLARLDASPPQCHSRDQHGACNQHV